MKLLELLNTIKSNRWNFFIEVNGVDKTDYTKNTEMLILDTDKLNDVILSREYEIERIDFDVYEKYDPVLKLFVR